MGAELWKFWSRERTTQALFLPLAFERTLAEKKAQSLWEANCPSAGTNCAWGGTVMKDVTAPSTQPSHTPCFQNCSALECNRGKGKQEGQLHAQFPHQHPWQVLHSMAVMPLNCYICLGSDRALSEV